MTKDEFKIYLDNVDNLFGYDVKVKVINPTEEEKKDRLLKAEIMIYPYIKNIQIKESI